MTDDVSVPDTEELLSGLLARYWTKLEQEREARLAGRIVEADFYVRQLSWFELVLDLGGEAAKLLDSFAQAGVPARELVATPVSTLLASVRRAFWAGKGEPERPADPALGRSGADWAAGEAGPHEYDRARDGDERAWRRRQAEKAALHAAAHRAWEEKAKADAEAWQALQAGST